MFTYYTYVYSVYSLSIVPISIRHLSIMYDKRSSIPFFRVFGLEYSSEVPEIAGSLFLCHIFDGVMT